jgi:hypothetical protein
MRAQRRICFGLSTLGVLAGTLACSVAPVLAASLEAPVTKKATAITATTATLHGELNPKAKANAALEYDFLYKPSASECAEGVLAPAEPVTAIGKPKEAVSVDLAGLEPSRRYTFCLTVKHEAEMASGLPVSFETLGMTPMIASEGASSVTATDAKLEAKVNPENQETTYHFEYATTEATVLEGKGTVLAGSPPAPPLQAVFEELTAGPTDIGGVLSPGTTYYWRAVATNATGSSAGAVERFTTPAKPIASTGEATSITRSSASLSGTVNPGGAETTYRFAYIDQPGYEAALAEGASDPYADGRSTTAAGAGQSFTVQPAGPVTIEELHPGTTYHYALLATNSVGTTVGPDQAFTTAAPTPPIALTGEPSGVTQLAATINGTVDTRELPTTLQFEFGTAPFSGSLVPATVIPGSGSGSTIAIATAFGGYLQPGTTYYYRAVATNQDGAAYGAERSFTTAAFPPAFTTPPTPPFTPYTTLAELSAKEATTSHTIIPKALTIKQKLARDLKNCARKPKKQRASCRRSALTKYNKAKRRSSKKR